MCSQIHKSKECGVCEKTKSLDNFHESSDSPDGHKNTCKECRSNHYKEYNRRTKKMWNIRYYNMKRRQQGKNEKHKGARGKRICTKQEFLDWCKDNKERFEEIKEKWQAAGYPRKLAPSVDRIDDSKGYTVDNIRWVTQSQNAASYFEKLTKKEVSEMREMYAGGGWTQYELADKYSVSQAMVNKIVNKKNWKNV